MSTIAIRSLTFADAETISLAFTEIGWDKPVAMYHRYLSEQVAGERQVFVAEFGGEFVGYATVVWVSAYPPFAEAGIPEIVDINVLPKFRRRGVASRLMDEAEAAIRTRSEIAGLGVGLYADYGPAQRLYILRGYVPDGRGVVYTDQVPVPGSLVRIDDNLVLHLTKDLIQTD
jgi:GNAT superfamily N-acetyltransferase